MDCCSIWNERSLKFQSKDSNQILHNIAWRLHFGGDCSVGIEMLGRVKFKHRRIHIWMRWVWATDKVAHSMSIFNDMQSVLLDMGYGNKSAEENYVCKIMSYIKHWINFMCGNTEIKYTPQFIYDEGGIVYLLIENILRSSFHIHIRIRIRINYSILKQSLWKIPVNMSVVPISLTIVFRVNLRFNDSISTEKMGHVQHHCIISEFHWMTNVQRCLVCYSNRIYRAIYSSDVGSQNIETLFNSRTRCQDAIH